MIKQTLTISIGWNICTIQIKYLYRMENKIFVLNIQIGWKMHKSVMH